MKNIFSKKKELDLSAAFKYPFNRATGMWNILWVLVPIFGWLALAGYNIRIIREFSKGKFKQLPVMEFDGDFKLGFFMFLKAIPFIIVCAALITVPYFMSHWLGVFFEVFMALLVFPILAINFFNKGTVESFFELKVLNAVFDNFSDYLVVLLKSVVLGIIFIFLILVLVGIPAGTFTKNIFLADFYRRQIR